MAQLTPKDEARIVGSCVEILSEVSRDPVVFGDAAAALALGTLCFFADPRKVVGAAAASAPDPSMVVFAICGYLAPERTRQTGLTPAQLQTASSLAKPFLARQQHLLVKAGQTFPVNKVLERARARVEQQAAKAVGIKVPDLEPAPYQTLVGASRTELVPDDLVTEEELAEQAQATPKYTRPAAKPAAPAEKPLPAVKPVTVPLPAAGQAPVEVVLPTATELDATPAAAPSAPAPAPSPAGYSLDCTLGDRDASLSSDDRSVFLGTLGPAHEPVTLVELRSPWILREDYVQKLREWANRLKQASGPHLARLLGLYQPQGRVFIVFSRVEGTTLDRILQQGPMDEAEVLSKLEEMATGVKALHAVGAVHRGLRPDRIVVDGQGRVVVFDPVSPRPPRTAGEEETLREKGLKGEVRYMSPELCLGQEEPTAASDIYSLGLVVCEMMLGEQNLQRIAGESVRFWLNWHVDLYKKPIPLNEIDPDISAELSDIVLRMLEKRVRNRYSDCSQLIADIIAARSGRKKAPRGGARGAGDGQGVGRKPSQHDNNLGAIGAKLAGIPPRTLAMGGGVAFMFLLCIVAALWKMGSGGGSGDTPIPADDPCKKVVEGALTQFRREDFDAATKAAEEATNCGPTSEAAITGLKRDIQKARSLKSMFKESMRKGREAESLSQTALAITHYQEASKTYKELSALVQQPDRTLPDELSQRLDALEPVRLLEEARVALKNVDPDTAKALAYRLMDNYPTSPAAKEADEFARKVQEVREKRKVFVESFDRGREHDHGTRYPEAIGSLWQAKLAYEDMVRACGTPDKAIPQDLRDRINQVLPKVWLIKTPTTDQKVVAENLIVEIQIPEKYFKEVVILGKSYPVRGEFMTLKITDLQEGNQLLEVIAVPVEGQRCVKKVAFTFNLPPEETPQIQIKWISSDKGAILAEIVYLGETYEVRDGWVSPDSRFTVKTVTKKSVEIETAKKKRIVIPY